MTHYKSETLVKDMKPHDGLVMHDVDVHAVLAALVVAPVAGEAVRKVRQAEEARIDGADDGHAVPARERPRKRHGRVSLRGHGRGM